MDFIVLFCKQGVNYPCFHKICKSNINIHRGNIHTNQRKLDSFCSNVVVHQIFGLENGKKNVKPQILGYLGIQNPINVANPNSVRVCLAERN